MLEKGDRKPSDRTIADICREFNISELWLRTGEGEPHIQRDEDEEFLEVMEQIHMSDDDLIKRIIKAYWFMEDDEKAAIKMCIRDRPPGGPRGAHFESCSCLFLPSLDINSAGKCLFQPFFEFMAEHQLCLLYTSRCV